MDKKKRKEIEAFLKVYAKQQMAQQIERKGKNATIGYVPKKNFGLAIFDLLTNERGRAKNRYIKRQIKNIKDACKQNPTRWQMWEERMLDYKENERKNQKRLEYKRQKYQRESGASQNNEPEKPTLFQKLKQSPQRILNYFRPKKEVSTPPLQAIPNQKKKAVQPKAAPNQPTQMQISEWKKTRKNPFPSPFESRTPDRKKGRKR